MLYKGKGNREECNNYRDMSLLSVAGKIYGRILNERMIKITDKRVGDEQGFRKGKGCIDQIFAVEILVEKYLEGMKSYYKNASASVWVNGELSESFIAEVVGVRQGCIMSPWLFNPFGTVTPMSAS